MIKNSKAYMELLNCSTEDEVFTRVRTLASDLTDKEHIILSSILFLHSVVEDELRLVIRQTFQGQLFLSSEEEDESRNRKSEADFRKMVDRLGFMDMYRLLKPVIKSWSYAYPDLDSILSINETRIQAAHARGLDKVIYKGRSPFLVPDCLAEMYLDVFSIRKSMSKFREQAISRSSILLQRYIDRFGTDLC